MDVDMVCQRSDRLGKGLLQAGLSGFKELRPRVQTRLRQLASAIEREGWIEPAAVCRIEPASRWAISSPLSATPTHTCANPHPALKTAPHVAIAFITLGARYDTAIARCSAQGNELEAYLLGEISLGALSKLVQHVEAFVRRTASLAALRAGSPIFPGESQLDLTAQKQMFDHAKAERIGITLSSSGMIIPVKSMSMLIAIDGDAARRSSRDACEQCSSFERCKQRRRRSLQSQPSS